MNDKQIALVARGPNISSLGRTGRSWRDLNHRRESPRLGVGDFEFLAKSFAVDAQYLGGLGFVPPDAREHVLNVLHFDLGQGATKAQLASHRKAHGWRQIGNVDQAARSEEH